MSARRRAVAAVAVAAVAVVVLAVLGIAATAGGWRALHRGADASPVADAHAPAATDIGATPASAAQDAGFSMARSSLRGSEVDGGLAFDATGHVVPDLAMRRLFDYFLSLVGERDPAQIRDLLRTFLQSRYDVARAAEALAYFDRYVAYLARLAEARLDALASPQDRFDRTVALRRDLLGETMATAFFADEEARGRLTLARMRIAGDTALSADEKARRLAALDADAGYTQRQEADTASLVAAQDGELARTHADPRQRAEAREALWGREAAERLAALDDARARWDARVADYLQARARIDADPRRSPADRARAVAALRAERFDAAEQRRIVSLEAIGQLKPGG